MSNTSMCRSEISLRPLRLPGAGRRASARVGVLVCGWLGPEEEPVEFWRDVVASMAARPAVAEREGEEREREEREREARDGRGCQREGQRGKEVEGGRGWEAVASKGDQRWPQSTTKPSQEEEAEEGWIWRGVWEGGRRSARLESREWSVLRWEVELLRQAGVARENSSSSGIAVAWRCCFRGYNS